MLVTLWWWQIWNVGGRIIMLVIFTIYLIGHKHPESVTNISNLSPTNLVSNISHQHPCNPLTPSYPWNIILVTSFATTDEIHNSITRSTFSFETTSVDTSQLCATSKESSSFGSSMDTRRIGVRSFVCYQKQDLNFHETSGRSGELWLKGVIESVMMD